MNDLITAEQRLGGKKLIFNSWEEAEKRYYETNDCISDNPDKEGARLERWILSEGHVVLEKEHTLAEWQALKNEAKRITQSNN